MYKVVSVFIALTFPLLQQSLNTQARQPEIPGRSEDLVSGSWRSPQQPGAPSRPGSPQQPGVPQQVPPPQPDSVQPPDSKAEPLSAGESVRLRADLVVVDLLPVQKKTGRIIGDVTQDELTVFEDGVKQSILHFSKDKLPTSIILLVDRAGCVNAFNDQIRLATRKAVGNLKPEDEVAIMTFSNKVSLVQPFTRDRKLISDQILAVEPQHSAEQHYFNAAIYEAAEYMRTAARRGGRRAIIALTSLEASIDFSKISEKKALVAVLESGAVVSGILVQTPGARFEQGIRGKPTSILRHLGLRSGSLKMFVEETGGELIGAPPPKIDETMTRLVDNISQSYTIAYAPSNTVRDGKRRKIRIQSSTEVEKRHGQTVLLSRRSYVAPSDTTDKAAAPDSGSSRKGEKDK
jgi:VWFA-related protein